MNEELLIDSFPQDIANKYKDECLKIIDIGSKKLNLSNLFNKEIIQKIKDHKNDKKESRSKKYLEKFIEILFYCDFGYQFIFDLSSSISKIQKNRKESSIHSILNKFFIDKNSPLKPEFISLNSSKKTELFPFQKYIPLPGMASSDLELIFMSSNIGSLPKNELLSINLAPGSGKTNFLYRMISTYLLYGYQNNFSTITAFAKNEDVIRNFRISTMLFLSNQKVASRFRKNTEKDESIKKGIKSVFSSVEKAATYQISSKGKMLPSEEDFFKVNNISKNIDSGQIAIIINGNEKFCSNEKFNEKALKPRHCNSECDLIECYAHPVHKEEQVLDEYYTGEAYSLKSEKLDGEQSKGYDIVNSNTHVLMTHDKLLNLVEHKSNIFFENNNFNQIMIFDETPSRILDIHTFSGEAGIELGGKNKIYIKDIEDIDIKLEFFEDDAKLKEKVNSIIGSHVFSTIHSLLNKNIKKLFIIDGESVFARTPSNDINLLIWLDDKFKNNTSLLRVLRKKAEGISGNQNLTRIESGRLLDFLSGLELLGCGETLLEISFSLPKSRIRQFYCGFKIHSARARWDVLKREKVYKKLFFDATSHIDPIYLCKSAPKIIKYNNEQGENLKIIFFGKKNKSLSSLRTSFSEKDDYFDLLGKIIKIKNRKVLAYAHKDFKEKVSGAFMSLNADLSVTDLGEIRGTNKYLNYDTFLFTHLPRQNTIKYILLSLLSENTELFQEFKVNQWHYLYDSKTGSKEAKFDNIRTLVKLSSHPLEFNNKYFEYISMRSMAADIFQAVYRTALRSNSKKQVELYLPSNSFFLFSILKDCFPKAVFEQRISF